MQSQPVEMRARIRLAARRDVTVTDDVGNRIVAADPVGKCGQNPVLRRHEAPGVAALEFDADREVIAMLAALPTGRSRVPGPAIAGNELDQFPIAAYQKMRRYLQMGNFREIGVGGRIEPIGKQRFDGRTTELVWRQAYGVDHDQLDRDARRPLIAVGRRDHARPRQPGVRIEWWKIDRSPIHAARLKRKASVNPGVRAGPFGNAANET